MARRADDLLSIFDPNRSSGDGSGTGKRKKPSQRRSSSKKRGFQGLYLTAKQVWLGGSAALLLLLLTFVLGLAVGRPGGGDDPSPALSRTTEAHVMVRADFPAQNPNTQKAHHAARGLQATGPAAQRAPRRRRRHSGGRREHDRRARAVPEWPGGRGVAPEMEAPSGTNQHGRSVPVPRRPSVREAIPLIAGGGPTVRSLRLGGERRVQSLRRQHVSQPRECADVPLARRRRGDVEHLGGLVVVQPLEVADAQDLAIERLERADGVPYALRAAPRARARDSAWSDVRRAHTPTRQTSRSPPRRPTAARDAHHAPRR